MPALRYEWFVRGAFGLAGGGAIDRCGDPACLADTDLFNGGNLAEVIAGATYSMFIYLNDYNKRNSGTLTDAEVEAQERIVLRVCRANSVKDVIVLIDEFREKYTPRK